jgi:Fe2+ or Zn2+ uptake regulation protein
VRDELLKILNKNSEITVDEIMKILKINKLDKNKIREIRRNLYMLENEGFVYCLERDGKYFWRLNKKKFLNSGKNVI